MIEPIQNDIGRKVRYSENHSHGAALEGVVTGFDLHHVYVRYRDHTTSKGIRRQDLEWVDETPAPEK